MRMMARTTEVGSRTLVHAASQKGEDSSHGKYLSDCMVEEPSELVTGEKGKVLQEKIWKELVRGQGGGDCDGGDEGVGSLRVSGRG